MISEEPKSTENVIVKDCVVRRTISGVEGLLGGAGGGGGGGRERGGGGGVEERWRREREVKHIMSD